MQKHSLSTNQNESGQSLVEMAISLIIMLTLLAGAIDFGIALYSYVTIRDAAQEGALYASIDPTNTTEIETRITSSSSSPVNFEDDLDDETSGDFTEGITVNYFNAGTPIDASQACEGDGAAVQVEVRYLYHPITPLFPSLLGIEEIPLTASVTNAILQPPCDS